MLQIKSKKISITNRYLEGLNIMSIVQLVGFGILIIGLFIYNSIIKLKCLDNSENKVEQPLLE